MPGGDDDDGGVIIIKRSVVLEVLHTLPDGHHLRHKLEEVLKEPPAENPGGTPTD